MPRPIGQLRKEFLPSTPVAHCPIQASLGALGRKWALAVLRDVTYFEGIRFSDFLRNNPGLAPRILTNRLRDLQREGLVERVEDGTSISYRLTPKGRSATPILAALIRFGIRHHAAEVFHDRKPRRLDELFPPEGCALLRAREADLDRGRIPGRVGRPRKSVA